MRHEKMMGFLALFIGVGLFSTVEVASKLIGARVHPLQMVFIRFFLTGLILLALAAPALCKRATPLVLRDYGVFALSICIVRRVIIRYGVFVLTSFSALFGSLMVLPFALVLTVHQSLAGLASAWAPTLYVALLGTALAYGLYYFGLCHGTAFQASMMFFLKPVMASLLAVLVLGEHINRFMVLGSALILGGLVITVSGHLFAHCGSGAGENDPK